MRALFLAIRIIAILAALAGTLAPVVRATDIEISGSTFAAIAYSPSTARFGYASNHRSRSAAQKAALRECDAEDAQIACWVNKGFCALALGDDRTCWGVGWRYGGGSSNTEAMNAALEECAKRTTGARIALCLSSDGQYVYKPEKPTPPIYVADERVRKILESPELDQKLQLAAAFVALCSNEAELKKLTPAQRFRLGLAYALDYPKDFTLWNKALREGIAELMTGEARGPKDLCIAQVKFVHRLDAVLGNAISAEQVSKNLRASKEFVELVSKACAQANLSGGSPADDQAALPPSVCKALANLLLNG
jgi:hypothetical protein